MPLAVRKTADGEDELVAQPPIWQGPVMASLVLEDGHLVDVAQDPYAIHEGETIIRLVVSTLPSEIKERCLAARQAYNEHRRDEAQAHQRRVAAALFPDMLPGEVDEAAAIAEARVARNQGPPFIFGRIMIGHEAYVCLVGDEDYVINLGLIMSIDLLHSEGPAPD